MNRPGVLLDRDGTIIADTGTWARSIGWSSRGAIEAIAALNRAGIRWPWSRTRPVWPGYYGIEDVHQVHKHMIVELARHGAHVDLWLFCPYHPDGIVESFARSSADRKPGPGMALAAAEALGLDLVASWVVGDSASDMGLARAVGAHPLHVGAGGRSRRRTSCRSPTSPQPRQAHPAPIHAGRRAGGPGRSFPSHQYADGGVVRQRLHATSSPGLSARSTCCRSPEPPRCSATPTSGAPRCSPAGTAARPRSPTTSSATTSRASATARTCATRVLSLSTNIELFSAIANDLGYDTVFEYQLESLAQPGDVLVAVSSSGRSPNIVRALEWANRNGVRDRRVHRVLRRRRPGARDGLRPRRRRATTGSSRTRTRPACTCSPSTSGSRG